MTKYFLFSVTRAEVAKPSSMFYGEFKYFVSFLYQLKVLSDSRLKFKEKMYLHYIILHYRQYVH